VVAGDRLYALSAAFSTLLTIDLSSKEVVGTHGLEGVGQPVGLAAKGDELFVVDARGAVSVVAAPWAGAPATP
jgi:hypothetical protein